MLMIFNCTFISFKPQNVSQLFVCIQHLCNRLYIIDVAQKVMGILGLLSSSVKPILIKLDVYGPNLEYELACESNGLLQFSSQKILKNFQYAENSAENIQTL